ncbi:DUF6691 family protein [Enterovibrio paralichthyis]|uniref:DUF6691 family protein n=1 Tax=Enterovibrio paralichthyis TaxID=2853805 RepID=UPI001C46DC60|nr:YeeE/YedE family protein [Enterovibrio paralichthyis]MBV7297340.1 YeeE/YedE family protein [Enterovibrio paralichthyis]
MLFRVVSLIAGFLFGLGMMISGMVDPAKVIGFLNIFGHWDPSLAFVMGGALMVFAPGYFLLVKKQPKPVLAETFCLSNNTQLDKKLIGGSALFGIGWGIAGICPGPAITALGSGAPVVGLFVLSMVAGMFIVSMLTEKKAAFALRSQS